MRKAKPETTEEIAIRMKIYDQKKRRWAMAVAVYVTLLLLTIFFLPLAGILIVGYGLLIYEIWAALTKKFNPEEW
jgi:hypothetical protein